LTDVELYLLLQQGGALPALRAAFGHATTIAVVGDLRTNQGDGLVRAVTGAAEDELLSADQEVPEANDVIPLAGSTVEALVERLPALPVKDDSRVWASEFNTPDSLHVIDDLMPLSCAPDPEAVEFLVSNRVAGLWTRYINEGRAAVDVLLKGDGGPWYMAIKGRFLREVEHVERLTIPPGWSFTKNGQPKAPNLMQRYVAWAIHERRRVGNWSGVGAGKTLSAVLAVRVAGARRILVVTNNATVDQWASEIANAYPDSRVHRRVSDLLADGESAPQYLVLNYEKFQLSTRGRLVRALLEWQFDFVVLDEVQLVKQRDSHESQRRAALVSFLAHAGERVADVRVLAMSATPVINNLREAKALLEATIGVEFRDLNTQRTLHNALALHRALMVHGFRYRPPYALEMRTVEVPVVRNDLLKKIQAAQGNLLALEQVLLPTKLDAVRAWLGPATLVYCHYVDGMITPARQFFERTLGLRVGLYTGTDKSGLAGFLKGRVDILLASRPVGTGLDGLQDVCHRLVFLSLPWTSAEYEQIIGRLRRQGSRFGDVTVIVPQVLLDHDGGTWSWDRNRMGVIRYKRTLSDCALDGAIPETVRISPAALLEQSRQALERWIARVESQGMTMLERPRLTAPLPPELREATLVRHGDFSVINRRWTVSSSRTTQERLQKDPTEWYLYHTLYREARATWPEHPVTRLADQIRLRPDWVVGDFGCGECLLQAAVPNRVVGLDHVAWDPTVIAGDMAATPLEPASLDVAVFSLSLMGTNWHDYLREAHRTLKPYGHLFIAEPVGRWRDAPSALRAAVEAAGFRLIGEVEQRYAVLYLAALRA
jgi:hypothetical protein